MKALRTLCEHAIIGTGVLVTLMAAVIYGLSLMLVAFVTYVVLILVLIALVLVAVFQSPWSFTLSWFK